MPLPKFDNEAEFRTKWVAPCLSKLGYILPTHNHGTGEQGKDFYFAEYDKFGHLRFNAAQVKLGNIGGGDTEIYKLLCQVRSCFDVELDYHQGRELQRISAVYIITSGTISIEAKRKIAGHCKHEHFGENVFFVEGENLENLERYATFMDDKTIRNRLVGLLNEVNYNFTPFKDMTELYKQHRAQIDCSRILALEDILRIPLPDNILPYRDISIYWEAVDTIKKMCQPGIDSTLLDTQIEKIGKGIKLASERLRDAISEAIQKIDSKYNLEITVIKPEEEIGS